ncbi:MalM family protein [Raoultella sp. T31]|uniref:MalM family protein n=1 Tax=Raoultella sp. T31 TaxID=2054594 RepID=UPI001D0D2446
MKNKKSSLNLSLLLISLMVTGCNSFVASTSGMNAHSFQEQVALDRNALEAKTAIDKLSNINYIPIQGDSAIAQINENSQVFSFNSEKSYVAAYSVEGKQAGRSVKLSSPLDFSVFIPSVMILDENFNVINVIKSSHFPYSEDSFGANLYKGSFSLPDGYTKLYLLIFTTTKDASGSTVVNNELLQNSMRYDRVSDVGKFSKLAVPHSTTGRIKLELIKSADERYAPDEIPARTPVCLQNTPRPVAGISAQQYYEMIRKSLSFKDYEQAIGYVREAECSGFTKARDVFFSVIEDNERKNL